MTHITLANLLLHPFTPPGKGVKLLSPGAVRDAFAGQLDVTILEVKGKYHPNGLPFRSLVSVALEDDVFTSDPQESPVSAPCHLGCTDCAFVSDHHTGVLKPIGVVCSHGVWCAYWQGAACQIVVIVPGSSRTTAIQQTAQLH